MPRASQRSASHGRTSPLGESLVYVTSLTGMARSGLSTEATCVYAHGDHRLIAKPRRPRRACRARYHGPSHGLGAPGLVANRLSRRGLTLDAPKHRHNEARHQAPPRSTRHRLHRGTRPASAFRTASSLQPRGSPTAGRAGDTRPVRTRCRAARLELRPTGPRQGVRNMDLWARRTMPQRCSLPTVQLVGEPHAPQDWDRAQ